MNSSPLLTGGHPERNRVFDLSQPMPGLLASAMVRACYGPLVPPELFQQGSPAAMEEYLRPKWRARIWELHDLHSQLGQLKNEKRAVYCMNCPPVGFRHDDRWQAQPCRLKMCPYCRARSLTAPLWNKLHDTLRWPAGFRKQGYRDDRYIVVVSQVKKFLYEVTDQEEVDAWRLGDKWHTLNLPGVLASMTTNYFTLQRQDGKPSAVLVKKSCFLLAAHTPWPPQPKPSRRESLRCNRYLPGDDAIVSAAVFATRFPRAWLDGTISVDGLDLLFTDNAYKGRKDTRWSGIWHGKRVYLA